MKPFPEKNEFKIAQGKIGMQELILVSLLVFIKFRNPLPMAERRQGPGDHFPFRDGQAGAG